MTVHSEKMVEAVARAMASATGKDPDEIISIEPDHGGWLERGPRWTAYDREAREQIAAFEAIREHLKLTGKQF